MVLGITANANIFMCRGYCCTEETLSASHCCYLYERNCGNTFLFSGSKNSAQNGLMLPGMMLWMFSIRSVQFMQALR
jgi:hypothetical protein